MIPFTLRVIKASLPYLTGADKSLDQLFELVAVRDELHLNISFFFFFFFVFHLLQTQWIEQKLRTAPTTSESEEKEITDTPALTLTLDALAQIDAAAKSAMDSGQVRALDCAVFDALNN
jgi:hypothetical protein